MFIRTKGTEIKTAPESQLKLSPFCSAPHPSAFLPVPTRRLYYIYQLCFPANISPPGKVCWPPFPPPQSRALPGAPSLCLCSPAPCWAQTAQSRRHCRWHYCPRSGPRTGDLMWLLKPGSTSQPSLLPATEKQMWPRTVSPQLAASHDAFNSFFNGGYLNRRWL